MKKIAVLTGGGDCPGLNNAIKQIVVSATGKYEVYGITEGWEGAVQMALHDDEKTRSIYSTLLNEEAVRRIDREGGTMLMSSRANPFKYPLVVEGKKVITDVSDEVIKFLNQNFYALTSIGGEDTQGASGKMSDENLGKYLRVVAIPKTIDKDLCGTQFTLGFDTAVNNVTNVLNDLRSTAGSHGMTYFVQIMGRRAGHLTYHSGIAANVHFMTIPEIETDVDQLFSLIQEHKLHEKYPGYHRDGKRYTIVAVAEGTRLKGVGEIIEDKTLDAHGNPVLGGVARYMMQEYIKRTGDKNARELVLGHIPRSGPPSCQDRIRGKFAGVKALELISKDEFGRMVSLGTEKTDDIPLMDVVDKIRVLDAQVCFDKDIYKPHLNSKFYHEREINK